MMVLKVTKIKGFTPLLENAVLEQQKRRGVGVIKLNTSPPDI